MNKKKKILTSDDKIVLSIKGWIFDEVKVRFFNIIGRSILNIDNESLLFVVVVELSFDDTIEIPPSLICLVNESWWLTKKN